MATFAPHDEQLSRAFGALKQAEGDVVTLDDLRRGGVKRPAQAIYELEAVGVGIDHVRGPGRGHGRVRAGYRLIGG